MKLERKWLCAVRLVVSLTVGLARTLGCSAKPRDSGVPHPEKDGEDSGG